MSRDLEERYLETRDRNLLLRKKNNEQEQTIKRLYTKIQMIEEGLRRRGHGSTMDASKSKTRTNKMDDVATSKLITDLKKRNMSLQKANTDLREKLRMKLTRLVNPEDAVVIDGKSIDVDEELGLKEDFRNWICL